MNILFHVVKLVNRDKLQHFENLKAVYCHFLPYCFITLHNLRFAILVHSFVYSFVHSFSHLLLLVANNTMIVCCCSWKDKSNVFRTKLGIQCVPTLIEWGKVSTLMCHFCVFCFFMLLCNK